MCDRDVYRASNGNRAVESHSHKHTTCTSDDDDVQYDVTSINVDRGLPVAAERAWNALPPARLFSTKAQTDTVPDLISWLVFNRFLLRQNTAAVVAETMFLQPVLLSSRVSVHGFAERDSVTANLSVRLSVQCRYCV